MNLKPASFPRPLFYLLAILTLLIGAGAFYITGGVKGQQKLELDLGLKLGSPYVFFNGEVVEVIMVESLDPQGRAAQAGVKVGDVLKGISTNTNLKAADPSNARSDSFIDLGWKYRVSSKKTVVCYIYRQLEGGGSYVPFMVLVSLK